MNNESLLKDMELFRERPGQRRAAEIERIKNIRENAARRNAERSRIGFGLTGKTGSRPVRRPAVSGSAAKNKDAKPKIDNGKAQANRINKAKAGLAVLGAGIVIIMVFMMIISAVQFHEVSRQITAVEQDIKRAQQDSEAMRREFDTKMCDKAVEDYAHSVLGMRKRESCQTEWITLQGGDIFAYAPKTSNDGWLNIKFDILLSYLD